MKYFVLVNFCLSYILFFIFPSKRASVSAVAALLLVILGSLRAEISLNQTLTWINWNVLGIFIGSLFLADLFIYSRAPAVLAEHMVNHTRYVGTAILLICILGSAISAFVENVATVLIVAPIAFALCKKVNVNPTLAIIGIAIASNLQGTATLIGDPPSMILAGYAKMNFNDFFIYHGRPGIFFAVQIGAIFSYFILWLFFRRNRNEVTLEQAEKVKTWFPVILITLMILLLAVSSFFDPDFSFFSGLICMILGFIGFLWYILHEKKSGRELLKGIDWETSIFLVGIFILVGALTEFGWVDALANRLSRLIGQNRFIAFVTIVTGSVLISAVVDNVPYLAAMLPVAEKMANTLASSGGSPNDRILLLFGLLVGCCLGGNITPIGASANIVGVGMLKKRGYEVSFGEFIKMGLPFTLAAVIPTSLFIWLVWS
jgi:Na+/H+ antiporter NhaD/arsenite permease-like protein